MEVFEGWQLANLVEGMMNVTLRAAYMFIGVFMLLRIVIEIYRVLIIGNMKFNAGPFVSMLVILIALLSYKEIMPAIGDGFYHFGTAVRGEAETEFAFTNIYEQVKEKADEIFEESENFLGVISGFAEWGQALLNPLDWLYNNIGIAGALTGNLLGLVLRFGMLFFKVIVYALLLISGPIPLVLSLIPGMQGLASHWMKSFLVVGGWNITLAMLDGITKGLNLAIMNDIVFGGNEEIVIGLLVQLVAFFYLFVPFITSLWMGQTVVAMAGSKLAMAPLAVGMAATKIGAIAKGGGIASGASTSKSNITVSHGNVMFGSSYAAKSRTSYSGPSSNKNRSAENAEPRSSTKKP